MSSSSTMVPPPIPISYAVEENEVQQTFAIWLYAYYHKECLQSVRECTFSESIMKLIDVFSEVNKDAYNAIYTHIKHIQIASLSPKELMDLMISHMGKYPQPASMSHYPDFMKNEFSTGTILENMASDWINLRNALTNPSQQVSAFRDRAIDSLKEVFYQHPEYKITMELMNVVMGAGTEITGVVKAYLKACVIALQLQVDCVDHGCFGLFHFVRNTTPFCIVDDLKAMAGEIFGHNNETVIVAFQRKMNSLKELFRGDLSYSLINCKQAVIYRDLIKTGISRAFNAIASLLLQTPIGEKLYAELCEAAVMVMNSVPATIYTATEFVPPPPQSLVEAKSYYEMVYKEKLYFMGIPTKEMVKRWGTIMVNTMSYLKDHHKNHPLHKECEALVRDALAMIGV